MYEICRLLAAKTPKAPRAPRKSSGPKIAPGVAVTIGRKDTGVVVERDTRYPNAWFVPSRFDEARVGGPVTAENVARLIRELEQADPARGSPP